MPGIVRWFVERIVTAHPHTHLVNVDLQWLQAGLGVLSGTDKGVGELRRKHFMVRR